MMMIVLLTIIDVQGIDNHQVPHLRLGKFGAVAKARQQTRRGSSNLQLICPSSKRQNHTFIPTIRGQRCRSQRSSYSFKGGPITCY